MMRIVRPENVDNHPDLVSVDVKKLDAGAKGALVAQMRGNGVSNMARAEVLDGHMVLMLDKPKVASKGKAAR